LDYVQVDFDNVCMYSCISRFRSKVRKPSIVEIHSVHV